MSLNLDPVTVMNFVLATAILIVGVWVYENKKEKLGLYVGAGFGLFAISHALTLLGYGNVQAVILPLRALGYLVVLAGLCSRLLHRDRAKTSPHP